MLLFVGSTNPVKVNAVTTAASEAWPDVQVVSVDVPSGISEQPFSDNETREGAMNRAKAAFQDGASTLSAKLADAVHAGLEEALGVGLEGGVEEKWGELWSVVWVAVYHPNDGFFEASGARFKVPEEIALPMLQGKEMGEVASYLMQGKDVRHNQGVIGLITENFVDRTEEYAAIAKMALGLWYGRKWSSTLSSQA